MDKFLKLFRKDTDWDFGPIVLNPAEKWRVDEFVPYMDANWKGNPKWYRSEIYLFMTSPDGEWSIFYGQNECQKTDKGKLWPYKSLLYVNWRQAFAQETMVDYGKTRKSEKLNIDGMWIPEWPKNGSKVE